MKAVVFSKYNSLDSLQLIDVEKPSPKENEVLVKVHAASINSWDKDIIKGIPFVNRIDFGLIKPKDKILGCDAAGIVEKIGSKVTELKVGDKVFGDISTSGMGAFGEYVCAPENMLAQKPEGMSYDEAAAIPHTGVLALQGLLDKGKLQKGDKVLINGAGGGSGTFSIQIAKLYGAEVTVVDSGNKLEMLRSLGADYVIDYTKEDFTQSKKQYDLILDVVTYRSIYDYKRILSPDGRYVMLGGGSYDRVFQVIYRGPWISFTERLSGRKPGKKMGLLMHKPNKKDLNTLAKFFVEGKVKPVIDKCYTFEEVIEAFKYYEGDMAQGKVIITISGAPITHYPI